jgi:uncharacterized protein YcbK (DUF882 family)
MKTDKTILTLSLLLLAAAGRAGDFGLNMITAADIRPSASAFLIPAPAAELSVMDEAETASYLADRETAAEAEEKAASGETAASLGGDGTVKLYHQWNKETLELRYRDERGRYLPEAMRKIKHLFRCRLTGREMDVPARLIEILDALQDRNGGGTVTVICGYRSPELNGALSSDSDGVAKKSLHMKGLAADIMIGGVRTSKLRDSAKALKAGGVGYYPSDGFVHVDVGAVRYW